MKAEPIIRHVSSLVAGTWGEEPDDSQNTVTCLRVADYDYARLTNASARTKRKISASEFNQKMLRDGDLLIEKSGGGEKTPVGRAIIASKIIEPTTYANFIERIRLKPSLNSAYVSYALSHLYSSKINTKYIKQNTGIQNLDVKAYLTESIVIPEIALQEKIVKYLDEKTQTLDKMIAAKNHTHTQLSELRQAIITNAVLGRGGADMTLQQTNIPWIGKIPAHWQVKKIKHVATVKARIGWQSLTTDEYIDEGPYLVTGTDFRGGIVDWKTAAHVSDGRWAIDSNIQLEEDDLLLTKDGTIGKVAIVKGLKGKATLNSGVFVIRAKTDEYNPRFLYHILSSGVFMDFIEYMKTGSTINHLYQQTFVEFSFPLPPRQEQDKIVAHIDKRLNQVNDAIAKVAHSTNLLDEYRSSLISNVVGGKVEV